LCQLGKQNEFHFLCLISIPHKIKQALVLLIKLLIVGAAFILFTINWQIAMPRLGEVHYFVQEESVGSRHYFHSALSVLNHFRNFKMESFSFT
jgi:hypothetical protein